MQPISIVDTVIFTVIEQELRVLLIKREREPFENRWALVGGYVDIQKDKTLEDTAKRKLQEKTGVRAPYLEQYATVGNAKRDPRGWSVTTVYIALIPASKLQLEAGPGACDIKWAQVVNGKVKEKLAFDHANLLVNCTERLRSKVLYTSLPVHLMADDFTLGELQKVYEVILEKKIDHKSFRRRLLNADLLEETGSVRQNGHKPAKLYRLKSHKEGTHFFMRNLEG